MDSTINSPESAPRTGLVRRLMSIVYDLLLVVALLFVVTAIENFAFNHGDAITPGSPFYWPYELSLVLVIFFYFGWFWTHGGQTLGMKTWKIKLCSKGGKPLGWKQATIYFLAASLPPTVFGISLLWSIYSHNHTTSAWQDLVAKLIASLSLAVFVIGFLWSLFDKNRATWHDRIARCEMLDLR